MVARRRRESRKTQKVPWNLAMVRVCGGLRVVETGWAGLGGGGGLGLLSLLIVGPPARVI